jgi:hypothetical protein
VRDWWNFVCICKCIFKKVNNKRTKRADMLLLLLVCVAAAQNGVFLHISGAALEVSAAATPAKPPL